MLRLNDSTGDDTASVCEDVAGGTWDLADDPVGPQDTQPISDTSRKASFRLPFMFPWEKVNQEIPVSESPDVEFSLADRLEQSGILQGPGAKGSDTLVFPPRGTTDRLNDFSNELIHLDGSESLQVAFIGGLRDLRPAVQICDSFAHTLPRGRALRGLLFRAIDLEVFRVIERRLDAQYSSFFVVDLDRIGIEVMFESDAFGTLPIMADHLSLKIAMGFSTQETQDISAAKDRDAAANQSGVNVGQGLGRFEQDIGRPFALMGRPIIIISVRGQHFDMSGIEAAGDLIENRGPLGVQLLIHQGLGFLHILYPEKTVLLTLITETYAVHLTRQPFSPVETDLDVEGKPTLNASMHKAKDGMHPVMIEKQTLSGTRVQFQLFLLPITNQFIAFTYLYRGQNTNQTFSDFVPLSDLPSLIFLARLGRNQVENGSFEAFGFFQRGRFQLLALLLEESSELFQRNFYVPEIIEHAGLGCQGPQGASQNQTVETTQMTHDIFFILFYKSIHGVLLGVGCFATSNDTPRVTPFLYLNLSN